MGKWKDRIKKVPKWIRITAICLAVIVLLVHIILPPVVRHIINDKLKNIDGYYGYIEDVDISLIRGAYEIQGIHIFSDELGDDFPLLEMKEIDISIQWKALFNKSLVAEVEFIEPHVYFAVSGKNEEKGNNFKAIKLTVFQDLLLSQVPLKINRMEVSNGKVHYIDKSVSPSVDVHLSEVEFNINNISNSLELSDNLISDFSFTSVAMNSAAFNFNGSFDPYDEDVSLDLDLELKKLELTKLNKLFLAYAFFDVEEGQFSVYSEVKVNKGELDGYVKPFVDNLDIVYYGTDKQKPLNLFWQALIGGSSKLIKNWNHDEIATKIPLKGTISDPKFSLLASIGNIFYHSFFYKFRPEIENKFSLQRSEENNKEVKSRKS